LSEVFGVTSDLNTLGHNAFAALVKKEKRLKAIDERLSELDKDPAALVSLHERYMKSFSEWQQADPSDLNEKFDRRTKLFDEYLRDKTNDIITKELDVLDVELRPIFDRSSKL